MYRHPSTSVCVLQSVFYRSLAPSYLDHRDISWFVFLMVCSVYYSGVSQAAVGCVCFNGKEMLTKLTWSHSGIISCVDLLKITVKYPRL